MKTTKNPILQKDIMQYKKNKLAANLALLGLVAGCIYFMVLYAQVSVHKFQPSNATATFYYKWSLAVDVIYNLFFLLFVFFFSEQVKNYKRNMFVFQIIVGALQIARIFWLPMTGYQHGAASVGGFIVMLIALALSGACVIASAVIGYIRSKALDNYLEEVALGSVDLDSALKEEPKDESAEQGKTEAAEEVQDA